MLVNPSLVAQRLSIATGVSDFDSALEAAVRVGSAQTLAKARYPQPDTYSGVTDYFYVPDPNTYAPLTIRLSRGFVSALNSAWSAVTLKAAIAGATGDGALNLLDTETATLLTDGERAFITIADCTPHRWISVTHSGGLPLDSSQVYEDVPESMREYAIAMSGLALQSHKSLSKEDFSAVDPLVRSAAFLLNDFTRARPGAYLPKGTVIA